jgi:hypothetical protein
VNSSSWVTIKKADLHSCMFRNCISEFSEVCRGRLSRQCAAISHIWSLVGERVMGLQASSYQGGADGKS